MTFWSNFGRLLECFGGFFGQNGAPEGVWEGKFDKIGRKKNRSKKHRKMKGYGWSRQRCWWGQAEGGESKDSSSGVFCKDLETATSLSDGPDPVPAANNCHRAYFWICGGKKTMTPCFFVFADLCIDFG